MVRYATKIIRQLPVSSAAVGLVFGGIDGALAAVQAESLKAAADGVLSHAWQKLERVFSFAKDDLDSKNIQQERLKRPSEDWCYLFCNSIAESEVGMEQYWGRVLAGEMETQGSFSKKTMRVMSSLTKEDAVSFEKICGALWGIERDLLVVTAGTEKMLGYSEAIIQETGLVDFSFMQSVQYFKDMYGNRTQPFGFAAIKFFNEIVWMQIPDDKSRPLRLPVGRAHLTRAGREIATLVKAHKNMDYYQLCLDYWKQSGIKFFDVYDIQKWVNCAEGIAEGRGDKLQEAHRLCESGADRGIILSLFSQILASKESIKQ